MSKNEWQLIHQVGALTGVPKPSLSALMVTFAEILQEISTCTNLYLVNRCEPATRIPAM